MKNKFKLKGIAAALGLAGLMAFFAAPTPVQGASAGEVNVMAWQLDAHPYMLENLLEAGYTVIIIDNRGTPIRQIAPGEGIASFERDVVPISQSPRFSAERESHVTNGAMRETLLEFINENMGNQNLGTMADGRITPEMQALSDGLLARMATAAMQDPAYMAFGLNEAGINKFYDSKTVLLRTARGTSRGNFDGLNRIVRVAMNSIENGVVRGLPPEDILHTLIYEVEGRGRGWEPILNRLAAEHLGAEGRERHGLGWDPSMERAAGEAAGGIHTTFAAADNGQEAFAAHMNENIPRANAQFTFTYNQWQTARAVDNLIRHNSTTVQGRQVSQEFIQRGQFGNRNEALRALRDLQQNIRRATDHNLPEAQRLFPNKTEAQIRQYGREANRLIILMYEIGARFQVQPPHSVNDERIAVVDDNNPEVGVFREHRWQKMSELNSTGKTVLPVEF